MIELAGHFAVFCIMALIATAAIAGVVCIVYHTWKEICE